MVLTAYVRALLGVHDLLVAVVSRVTTRKLDTSPGASGPHDLAVRTCVARLAAQAASIAFHPALVPIAIRPSFGMETGANMHLIYGGRQANFFKSEKSKQNATGLKHLVKSTFPRDRRANARP
jgi:hypothetical protein